MQAEHRNTAILLALLSIPFGVAVYKDATASPRAAVDDYARYADEYDYDDDYDYDSDYDSDYEVDVLAEEAEVSVMSQDFFERVLFDGGDATVPTLSGPIHQVAIGASLESISDAYPGFEDWDYEGIPGFDDAVTSMDFVADKLQTFQIGFPDDGSTVGILSKQWGPGLVSGDSGETLWYVPSKSLRVSFETDYEEGLLEFTSFQTLEELIAPSEALFAFEQQDVFSLSEDEVRNLPDYGYGEASMALPFLKEGSESVAAWFQLEDDKVVEVAISLAIDSDTQDRALSLLKKKLGKAKRQQGDYETIYTFRQGKRIVVWTTDDSSYSSLSLQQK